MIDKTIIKSLLDALHHNIRIIETKDFLMEDILQDEDVQAILDRRMQLAIESCIDMATHIIASMGYKKEDYASDAFLSLANKKIISNDLAKKMGLAAGFRNILVHDYTKIDYTLAYLDLDEKLKDLKAFGKEVLRFIENN